MLYLKMMSGEDLPDSHGSKTFQLVGVDEACGFKLFRLDKEHETDDHPEGSPGIVVYLSVDRLERICYYPEGNTYIMNGDGKTIGTFSHMPPCDAKDFWHGKKVAEDQHNVLLLNSVGKFKIMKK